jgi:antitoxin component of RelBE/YafQ-DinJ toxin-antitoxin module
MAKKYHSVKIEETVYLQIQQICERTGLTITGVISRALDGFDITVQGKR